MFSRRGSGAAECVLQCVAVELQSLADSQDPLTRGRGVWAQASREKEREGTHEQQGVMEDGLEDWLLLCQSLLALDPGLGFRV